ncbi:hypothetical protein DFP93_13062 [Aneurinibacillus soli]|uniref:Uncharacterized protein n=1 Tax=Aneurinibacillus soli TaxID=1500254 RepID=A0A0U5C3D5_9BACL|nr:hypothetical protein [Aneurinibacillus soli]PYE57544.1 hypothetical protein DFP93_13062 [Aneurinibacillus soli]BAU26067.1 hypothetical protein CB4_00156 [Aneurinibacillus soli]
MENNIVSFETHVRAREKMMREKLLSGIDRREVYQYYENVIRASIEHLTLLQRYIVEEYLAEIITSFFIHGVDASREYELGRTDKEIERAAMKRLFASIYSLSGDYRLSRHLNEWDLYSISVLAEDLAGRWFQHGLAYGRKQRKLRLL